MRESIFHTSIVNPKDNITYSLGDIVEIYQGRFGHNNIMKINSIFSNGNDIFVSNIVNTPGGTFIQAIKRKLTDKEFKKIQKAQNLCEQYKHYKII